MPSNTDDSAPVKALRKLAMALPQTEEGTSCQKAAFRAGNKSFLFVGRSDNSWNAMLKLRDSLPEAVKLAAKEPQHYSVGRSGWVSTTFNHRESPPQGLMPRWIEESYRLLVPKKLAAQILSGSNSPARATEANPRKQSPRPKKVR